MSQTQHLEENHTEYNLPRDDAAELVRLDEQAKGFFELMHKKIVHAPLYDAHKLIDVGCGTGIVSRHLARQFPSAKVFGVDISPIPPFSDTPPNVEYIIGDIKQLSGPNRDEGLKGGEIDYIYQRLLVCGMTDWPGYIQQMASLLRPGGYLEIHEYAELCCLESPTPNDNGNVSSKEHEWQRAMRRGAAELGLDLNIGHNAEKYMRDAGLVEVQIAKYKVPMGKWMADEDPETAKIGAEEVESLPDVFANHIIPGVTRTLGIEKEKLEALKDDCRASFEQKTKFRWFYAVWGRKP